MRTRRGFMEGLGAAWLAASADAIAAAAAHAHASMATAAGPPPVFETLSAAQARDIEAITSCIVPSGDDGPGAREAGVVFFIDRALGSFFASQRDTITSALAALPQRFADLDEPAQIAALSAMEGQPLFESLRLLTILGMFASPSYGGNRGALGWQLIGFEDVHAFQPPFGYYDRDYPGFEPAGKPS
jgi:gluconate 2-dehydrogenase gamma chain